RREKIERHVKKALTYPIFVIIVAFILTLGLFRTVIPGILDTVIGLGVELPAPTKLLMWIVAMIEQPLTWLFLVVALIASVAYARSPEGKERLLFLFIHIPVMGPIITYSS